MIPLAFFIISPCEKSEKKRKKVPQAMYKLQGIGYNDYIKSTKEQKMIRTAIGFLMVFGAVGGMDNATDAQLLPLLAIAVLGLIFMLFGVRKIEQRVF